MQTVPLSRRGFFAHLLLGAGAAGATHAIPVEPILPQQAWLIVAGGWEHNDEFTYAEGESPRTDLFFDQDAANSECQRLCGEFFTAEAPADFEVDFAAYFEEVTLRDFDELTVTWKSLHARGFPDPYYVLELGASELRGGS